MKEQFPFEIHIQAADNSGFIAHVGCKRFVYTDVEKMIEAFAAYMRNPATFHEKYKASEPECVPYPTATGRNY